MNGSILAGIPFGAENRYRPTILLSKRDPSIPEPKTIRIFKWNTTDDDKKLTSPESSLSNKQRRPTPYERPDKLEVNRPIKISKTTRTIIEIDKPHDYFDRKLVEKSLGYLLFDPTEDNEDKPMIDVKKEEEKTKN